MLLPLFPVLLSLLLASPTLAASADDWSKRSIYQLVTDRFATSNNSVAPCDTSLRTYCGGSWTGIIDHLDYIQQMGFDAVWISPIAQNAEDTAYGKGYHGYWSTNLDALNPHFGADSDLKALSKALHARAMYLMLDVVVNHYAGVPTNTTISPANLFTLDYSSLLPFGTQDDFHPQCFIGNSNDQAVLEQCWLGDENLPLPDVNTEDPGVVATLNAWIKKTVSEYGADGIRIDTVKHIRRNFWPDFVKSAGVFALGEILTTDPVYAASYLGAAVDGVFDYPKYYQTVTAFGSTSGNLSALQTSPSLPALAPPSAPGRRVLTAAFLENHDQPRFPSYASTDTALTKNAMTSVFVGDGMPVLYYGQEQGYQGGADPGNREALWLSGYETNKPLVAHVKALNAARKLAIAKNPAFLTTQASWIQQSNPSALMLSKPPILTLLTNIGANTSAVQPTWHIPAGMYKPNTTLVDLLACQAVVVDGGEAGGGATEVRAQGGMPQVLVPASMLSRKGDGACPALAGAGGSSGAVRAGRGRVVRGLAAVGTVVGVVGLL
ncbi:glycoside hydrolase family 13 protein [Mycena alexandri]|uniref:alpha-amylase n=1 Tax=Mycena alexandri TaxID=1745969 RepID=A0AAD6SPG6_9AGAR|nr:glycoside hydrolase family 13 protein [Mycena alexandri]